MFKLDHIVLPQLVLRKALIIVDFQTEFITPGGVLATKEPEGYVDRTLDLAHVFRSVGDIAWVRSDHVEKRQINDGKIITSDGARQPSTDRIEVGMESDEEAFLSHNQILHAKSSPASDVPEAVLAATDERDTVLLKSHYSSFEGTTLLRSLRTKMITEVYICGSLVNIGVYATALDAAGHGMAITIIEDCCGYRSEQRRSRAMKSLLELTGCDIISADELLRKIRATRLSEPEATQDATLLGEEIVQPMSHLSIEAGENSADRQAEADAQLAPERPTEQALSQSEPSKIAEHSRIETFATSEKATRGGLNSAIQAPKNNSGLRSAQSIMDAPVSSLDMKEQDRGKRARNPVLMQGAGGPKGLCEGDTGVIENVLPTQLAGEVFETLREEVQWQRMSHQGGEVPRLVAVQGEKAIDGSIPIYRHPSDESPTLLPFSPSVQAIKTVIEESLGHSLNHVLIQFYRDGHDYISEHSDKTLDIMRGSYIANVSLGAERTMVLRTKRPSKDVLETVTPGGDPKRRVQRAILPHNSLFRMGLRTNMKWLHSIRQDKRANREKSAAEVAYGGKRISLTFRQIGTFLSQDEGKIWGQGATSKTRDGAGDVINGESEEGVQMIRAFGNENHSSDFDWNAQYGEGFDVLHLRAAPRLFVSMDSVTNTRVSLMLAEYGIKYAKGSMGSLKDLTADRTVADSVSIKYVDNRDGQIEVYGDMAIMLYLHSCHQGKKSTLTASGQARQFTFFQKALLMLPRWNKMRHGDDEAGHIPEARAFLAEWNDLSASLTPVSPYIGGEHPDLADFAFWPVLHEIVRSCGGEVISGYYPSLDTYYNIVKQRDSTKRVVSDNVTSTAISATR